MHDASTSIDGCRPCAGRFAPLWLVAHARGQVQLTELISASLTAPSHMCFDWLVTGGVLTVNPATPSAAPRN
jgi:hypothetical protein